MRRNLILATLMLSLVPCPAQTYSPLAVFQDPQPSDASAGADRSQADAGTEPRGGPHDEPTEGSAPVPEPSTLLLVGSGLVGVALSTRLRRRKGTND